MAITGTTGDFIPRPKREIIPVNILQELRIGSYVIFKNELTCVSLYFFKDLKKLDKIYLKDNRGKVTEKGRNEFISNVIKGIELNEELLTTWLKFKKQKNYEYNSKGKEQYETTPYYFHQGQIEMWDQVHAPALYFEKDKFKILGGSYPEMKYLHQYQNLFLALTGEEMIINRETLKNYIEK
jgi:hypothetical protein